MRVEIETKVSGKTFQTDLYCWKDGTIHHKKTEGTYEGTKDAVSLAAAVAGLERMRKPSTIIIKTDSDYVYAPFKNGWFEAWKENGWLNSKGKLIRNDDLWRRFAELAAPHEVKVQKGA